MKPTGIAKGIPVVIALAGVAMVTVWLAGDSRLSLPLRVPGMDRSVGPAGAGSAGLKATSSPSNADGTSLTTSFAKGPGAPSDLPGAWPAFRGGAYDGISHENAPLSWPAEGPRTLWSASCGEGYAGPAVLNGRVYLLDYDQGRQADALRCLSLADGKEIWRRWYFVDVPKQHGISRTVPAVSEKYVVTLGPMCQVMCCDAVTGEYLWGLDLVKRYGTTVPPWYAGQCPMIDGQRVILAPAGSKMMIALDAQTGKVVWETPNPGGWKMSHGSIVPMTFAGRRMFIYASLSGVVGVSADDGSPLWEYPNWTVPMANVPTPVPVGEGRIFLSGGYRAGSMMLQLAESGGKFTAKELFRLKQEVFGSEQQTPIFFNGYIYGVLTKDAGTLKEQLVCLDLSGSQRWTSGRENRFGPYGGPYLIAQNKLFLVNDDGVLTIADASPDGYKQLGRWTLFKGKEFWAPMALAGGRLLVRDLTKMVCLDLTGK